MNSYPIDDSNHMFFPIALLFYCFNSNYILVFNKNQNNEPSPCDVDKSRCRICVGKFRDFVDKIGFGIKVIRFGSRLDELHADAHTNYSKKDLIKIYKLNANQPGV